MGFRRRASIILADSDAGRLQAEACRHPNIKLVVVDGNVDVAKQNNDVRDLLARGVDAVLMSPVESGALVPAARAVMSAGSAYRHGSRRPDRQDSVYRASNVTMAEGVAEKMAKDLGGKGNIVVITGLKGSSAAVDRDKGMKNVLAKYPDIKILATGDGQWIRDPSVPIMEDFLTAYPKIDAVFSHAKIGLGSPARSCARQSLQGRHQALYVRRLERRLQSH